LAVPANSYPGFNNNNNDNDNRKLEDYTDFAIDLTQYALKYIGCSNIRTWSDDLAAEDNNDSVLQMDKFVVLRLCPRDSCSNYNQYGCLEKFGDYLLPMEIYLQTMAETFFTQYQEYCETCYECMTGGNNNDDGGNYQNYNNNNNYNNGGNYNNNGRNYNNNYDNYNNYNNEGNYYNNNGNRRLNDDAYYPYDDGYFAADDAAGAANDDYDQAQDCEYYSICALYKDTCQEYTNLGFELEDYFECAEFNIGNSKGYMGPHCASDGKTISMGIFNDDSCNDYSADISEVSSYMAYNQNDLEAYYSPNCISCLASDGYTLEGANDDDQYNIITDICGALYGESAKCNKYMGNDGDYASSNQEEQEDTVCNFIENLLTKSYNEYGEIILQEIGWKTYIPTPTTIRKMQKWQKYLLTFSILGSLCMYLYALYLYRAIQRRKRTWYPRGRKGYSTGYPGDPVSISGRLHSGIIQGRSHSSGNFDMKHGGVLS